MSKDIIQQLKDLSEEELAEVAGLIKKLVPDEPKKKKRRRKKRVDRPESEPIVEAQPTPQKKKRRTRKKDEDFDIKRHRSTRRKGSGKGMASTTQSVDTESERVNLFETQATKLTGGKLHKDIYKHDKQAQRDREITKALKEGQMEVSERRKSNLVEVECIVCGNSYDIPPQFIQREGGEWRWTCDRCSLGKR